MVMITLAVIMLLKFGEDWQRVDRPHSRLQQQLEEPASSPVKDSDHKIPVAIIPALLGWKFAGYLRSILN